VAPVRTIVAAVRLIHPAPATAVTLLSAALGGILLGQAGRDLDARWLATVASVAGSQILVGATNDLVDMARDRAAGRSDKPLVVGDIGRSGAMVVVGVGLAIQLVASAWLGVLPLLIGLAAVASALAYNAGLARTPLSVIPYVVSFGLLPLWVAAGVGVPLDRVAAAPLLVAPFAAAAHLANAVRDFGADRTAGSRDLAQLIGERRAFVLAWVLAMATGVGVGAAFALGGRLDVPGIALGLTGLAAVAQGLAGPQRLWIGMLVAAVAWTAAWAIGSG
jgi:4-hydroxybenzoate polyprenyltransferase